MHHRPTKNWLGCFYWRTVRRWPAIYFLVCAFGVAVGIGALYTFGEPETDMVKRAFLRVFGGVMIVVYGWFIVACVARLRRGVWNIHCDRRILFFSSEKQV